VTRGVIAALLLAIAVFALVVAWGDAPAVLASLSRFPPGLIVPVVALTIWNYALRWLRWNYYLRVLGVTGVSRTASLLVFLSGFAMGLTPGKSGELTKSYWLREIAGAGRAPLARTAPIVFAERLVDGIAMLLLATSGLISFRFGAFALLAVAALACVAVGALQAHGLVHGVLAVARRRPRLARAADLLATVYDSARELLSWRRLAVAVGVGIVSWGGECLALYLIVLGLGAPPSLVLLNQATFALAAGSLVGSASLLPGGIGAAEGTVAAVLDLVAGQPRDVAAAATLLIRTCTLWFGVALGAVSLVALTRAARPVSATTHAD
jgi:glycosyltransferase 2 family protein